MQCFDCLFAVWMFGWSRIVRGWIGEPKREANLSETFSLVGVVVSQIVWPGFPQGLGVVGDKYLCLEMDASFLWVEQRMPELCMEADVFVSHMVHSFRCWRETVNESLAWPLQLYTGPFRQPWQRSNTLSCVRKVTVVWLDYALVDLEEREKSPRPHRKTSLD